MAAIVFLQCTQGPVESVSKFVHRLKKAQSCRLWLWCINCQGPSWSVYRWTLRHRPEEGNSYYDYILRRFQDFPECAGYCPGWGGRQGSPRFKAPLLALLLLLLLLNLSWYITPPIWRNHRNRNSLWSNSWSIPSQRRSSATIVGLRTTWQTNANTKWRRFPTYTSVVNGAEWLGGNSQQVTGDSGLIWDYSLNNKFEVEESNRREADRLSGQNRIE